jgi:glycosyltransferase involved in cell wall biosynthesis
LVAPLALFAATRAHIPYVVTFHSGGHGSRFRNRIRTIQALALRPLLSNARALIAVSEFEAQMFRHKLRLSKSRFVTIPNGASMDMPTHDPGPPELGVLILSVGRLEKYKGHQRVIAALPHVLAQEPSARLRIVGAGPYEESLRQLARSYGVADRVEIGRVDPQDRQGMARLLVRASVVALLSEYEANPVAVMEALALRRRVLVADTSGLTELARRGLARAISLESGPEETARAILDQIAADPPPDFKLPSWDECAAQIAEVYRNCLQPPQVERTTDGVSASGSTG